MAGTSLYSTTPGRSAGGAPARRPVGAWEFAALLAGTGRGDTAQPASAIATITFRTNHP